MVLSAMKNNEGGWGDRVWKEVREGALWLPGGRAVEAKGDSKRKGPDLGVCLVGLET